MAKASRGRRASRLGLGLLVVAALGFAADALVLVTTRAHADAPAVVGSTENGRRPASSDSNNVRSLADRLARKGRAGDPDLRSLAMVGITVALAACGGIVAVGRRLLPKGAAVGMQVVGRVSLSPKHTIYMLRVGRRTLLVGAGPQGAPALISELDELAEIEPDLPRGEQT